MIVITEVARDLWLINLALGLWPRIQSVYCHKSLALCYNSVIFDVLGHSTGAATPAWISVNG